MSYTLQECLERSGAFRRGKYVYRVLSQNGIKTWDDLLAHQIPGKGLYSNEVLELDKLRRKQIHIYEMKNEAMRKLSDEIEKIASCQETIFISRALMKADIYSITLLCTTPDEKLAAVSGIGPKRLDILKKVKAKFKKKQAKSGTKLAGDAAASCPFQPLLAF